MPPDAQKMFIGVERQNDTNAYWTFYDQARRSVERGFGGIPVFDGCSAWSVVGAGSGLSKVTNRQRDGRERRQRRSRHDERHPGTQERSPRIEIATGGSEAQEYFHGGTPHVCSSVGERVRGLCRSAAQFPNTHV